MSRALLRQGRGVRGHGRRGPVRVREEMRAGQAPGVRHGRATVREQMRIAQIRLFDRRGHTDRSFVEVFHTVR